MGDVPDVTPRGRERRAWISRFSSPGPQPFWSAISPMGAVSWALHHFDVAPILQSLGDSIQTRRALLLLIPPTVCLVATGREPLLQQFDPVVVGSA